MGLCFAQCCCPIHVEPLDSYGHPIVGAQVWAYWNAATQGAYADPTRNDSSAGPYTTTSSGAIITGADPSNGIYLIKITATGYADQLYYMFACGKTCSDIFPTTNLVNCHASSPRTITTNVQTTPFTLIQGGQFGTRLGVPISGTLSDSAPGAPNPSCLTISLTGGAFTVMKSVWDIPTQEVICSTITSTPGWISIACGNQFAPSSGPVTAVINLVICPLDTFYSPTSSPPTPPSSFSVTGYGVGSPSIPDGNGFVGPVISSGVGSSIQNIQFNPPLVEGTWNTAYSLFPGEIAVDYFFIDPGTGLGFHTTPLIPFNPPGSAYQPLTGTFTIQ